MNVTGRITSSGVVSGTYVGWEFEWLPVELNLLGVVSGGTGSAAAAGLPSALMAPKLEPLPPMIPYVEIEDTSVVPAVLYPVTDLEFVSYSRNSETEQDTYTIRMADGEKWTPDGPTYPGLLTAGAEARNIYIYGDILFRGQTYRIKLFTGTLNKSSGGFTRGDAGWTITGSNLAQRLKLGDGSTSGYRGSRQGLLITYMPPASTITSLMAIPDEFVEDESWVSPTILGTINAYFRSKPTTDHYVDQNGMLVAHEPTPLDTNWVYDTKLNVTAINPSYESGQVVTQVPVSGATDAASITYLGTGEAGIFGSRTGGLSSTVLSTQADSEVAAQAVIDKSTRPTRRVALQLTYPNPYQGVTEKVKVTDYPRVSGGYGSGFSATEVVIRSISYSWSKADIFGTMTLTGDKVA